MNYYKVLLRRPLSLYAYYVEQSYIPEKFAKKGQILTLKDNNPEYGWIVISVDNKISEEEANKLYTRNKAFKEKEVAGRKSYKTTKLYEDTNMLVQHFNDEDLSFWETNLETVKEVLNNDELYKSN